MRASKTEPKRLLAMIVAVFLVALVGGCASGPAAVVVDAEKKSSCECKVDFSKRPPPPGEIAREEIEAGEGDGRDEDDRGER